MRQFTSHWLDTIKKNNGRVYLVRHSSTDAGPDPDRLLSAHGHALAQAMEQRHRLNPHAVFHSTATRCWQTAALLFPQTVEEGRVYPLSAANPFTFEDARQLVEDFALFGNVPLARYINNMGTNMAAMRCMTELFREMDLVRPPKGDECSIAIVSHAVYTAAIAAKAADALEVHPAVTDTIIKHLVFQHCEVIELQRTGFVRLRFPQPPVAVPQIALG